MNSLIENEESVLLNETQVSFSDLDFVVTTSSEVESTKFAWTGEVCDHGTGSGE